MAIDLSIVSTLYQSSNHLDEFIDRILRDDLAEDALVGLDGIYDASPGELAL